MSFKFLKIWQMLLNQAKHLIWSQHMILLKTVFHFLAKRLTSPFKYNRSNAYTQTCTLMSFASTSWKRRKKMNYSISLRYLHTKDWFNPFLPNFPFAEKKSYRANCMIYEFNGVTFVDKKFKYLRVISSLTIIKRNHTI